MKSLIIGAVAVAACTAIADINVDDGVYSFSFTQKYLEPTFEQEDADEPMTDSGFDTKKAAQEAVDAAVAEIKAEFGKVKSIKIKKGEDGWEYSIKYSTATEEIESAKTVTETINGLYFRRCACAEDGAAYTWDKSCGKVTTDIVDNWSKVNTNGCPIVITLKDRKLYPVCPAEVTFEGDVMAKKAWGTVEWDGIAGAGIGSALKDEDGYYSLVKSVAGNVASVDEEMPSFGTWKFQKDAAATKLAKKGASLVQILYSKGLELGTDKYCEECAE